jgi:hypothetical protein
LTLRWSGSGAPARFFGFLVFWFFGFLGFWVFGFLGFWVEWALVWIQAFGSGGRDDVSGRLTLEGG